MILSMDTQVGLWVCSTQWCVRRENGVGGLSGEAFTAITTVKCIDLVTEPVDVEERYRDCNMHSPVPMSQTTTELQGQHEVSVFKMVAGHSQEPM